MPFVANTPESLLNRSLLTRSDSKNPRTTCQGITTNGRPCRRNLPRATNDSLGPVVDTTISFDLSRRFCYQHKDQAASYQENSKTRLYKVGQIRQKSSIDTLAERLGVLDIQDSPPVKRVSSQNTTCAPEKSSAIKSEKLRHKRRQSIVRRLCCFGDPEDDDYAEIVRHKKRQPGSKSESHPSKTLEVSVEHGSNHRITQDHEIDVKRLARRAPVNHQLSELIPNYLDDETKVLLAAELSKPISQHDEDGFIYVYKIDATTDTFSGSSTAAERIVRPPPTTRPDRGISTSEVEHNVPGKDERNTVVVKVGRTSNVQRRLTTWSRQCGYELSLIRYYPYSPTRSPSALDLKNDSRSSSRLAASGVTVKKVRHCHRVERLIHIELAAKQVNQVKCGVCGRKHREFFEVEATREGIRHLDKVIKRWVNWAQSVDVA